MPRPINVGIIGYGFSVKCFNLPFILPNPDLNVYAFLQRAPAPTDKSGVEPGKHCTVDYPDAKHYRTADEFFADPEIELVVVCTKHDSHAEYAERALKANKHVVVEKCFTVTTEQADKVLEAAKHTDKILTVFQNRRYDSDFRTLRHLVQQKAFGKITECEIHYDVDFPPWMQSWKSPDYNPGNGMMFGLGSHTVDQALLLFGRPSSVTGFYRALRGIESKTDDAFTMILQYSGEQKNLIVTIKTSVVTTMQYPLKYFIRGYDGSFLKFGDDKQEVQTFAGQTPLTPGFGVEPEATWGLLTTKSKIHENQEKDERTGHYVGKFPSLKGEYTKYYTDLVKAIRGEQELYVKPELARDGIRIIELARESAEKGVTLPFPS
ncbi:hypothetical protein F5884DRAFT_396414 [Xylogone sp. PMI_703]|nr:hypothetical protein F5884DRAFT_396414 [Xylogone sp. PMI_703]